MLDSDLTAVGKVTIVWTLGENFVISERIFVRRLARGSLHSGPKLAVLLMHLEFDRVVLGGSERVEHNCSELTAFKVAFGRFERQVSKFFLTEGGTLTTAWDEEHL